MQPIRFLIAPPQGYYFEGGGVRQSFALSPDGGRIAFTAKDTGGSFRLFLRDFSEVESRPVVDGEGAYSVVWTPDGRALLFTAKGMLRRLWVNAAASQIVSEVGPYISSAIPFGPDRLLVSNHRNSGVMPSSGGTPHALDRVYSWAQLLPGGRDFLYTAKDPQLRSLGARITTIDGADAGVDVVHADSGPVQVRPAPTAVIWSTCVPERSWRKVSMLPRAASPRSPRQSPAAYLPLVLRARPIFRFRDAASLPTSRS
jgi:hypothetical protein